MRTQKHSISINHEQLSGNLYTKFTYAFTYGKSICLNKWFNRQKVNILTYIYNKIYTQEFHIEDIKDINKPLENI